MAGRVDHAARRLKIAESATQLFSKRGYDNVSLGDVAEAAGVARTVLYRDFHSKREVLDEAIFAHTRAIVANCTAVVAGLGSARAKLLAVCSATVDGIVGERAFLTAIFDFALTGFRRGEDMGVQVHRFTWRLRETLRDLVAAGVTAGEFAPDTDVAATAGCLMAILEALAMRLAFGLEADAPSARALFSAVVARL